MKQTLDVLVRAAWSGRADFLHKVDTPSNLGRVVLRGLRHQACPRDLDDYGAYFRLLGRGIDAFVANPDAAYPDMVGDARARAQPALLQ